MVIQKFSRLNNIARRSSCDLVRIFICSISVNLACVLKLCLVSLKCLQTGIVSSLGLRESLRWLFSLTLNGVSLFPTYCSLQSIHYKKYIIKVLQQLRLWRMSNCCFV